MSDKGNKSDSSKEAGAEDYQLALQYQSANDMDKCFAHLEKAAVAGHCSAQGDLAMFFDREKNVKQAMLWWHRAAEQGCVNSMYNLGSCYYQQGNESLALKWYEMAAELGKVESMGHTASILYNHARYCLALKWLQKSLITQASGDDKLVCHTFGELLSKEEKCVECGTPHQMDYPQAIGWLRKGAEKGYKHSQYLLASLLDPGKNCNNRELKKNNLQNIWEAVPLYEAAAKQDHAGAMWDLYYCYEKGLGVEKDLVKANELLKILTEKGDGVAGEKLFENKLQQRKHGDKKNQEVASWCLGYAKNGKSWAMFCYGKFCWENLRRSEGLKWLHCAAMNGNNQAKKFLTNATTDLGAMNEMSGLRDVPREGYEANFELMLYYVDDVQDFLCKTIDTAFKEGRWPGVSFVSDYGLNWEKYLISNSQMVGRSGVTAMEKENEQICLIHKHLVTAALWPSDILHIICQYLPWFSIIEEELRTKSKRQIIYH